VRDGNYKTIELLDGHAHGERVVVPAGANELTLPNPGGYPAWTVYRPNGELGADGIEMWTAYTL
jgi:hypothetical protein